MTEELFGPGEICSCCVVNLTRIKESSKCVCLYLHKMWFTIKKAALKWSAFITPFLSSLKLRDIEEHWAEYTSHKIGKQLWRVSVTGRDTAIMILQQLQLSTLGLYKSWTSSCQTCLRKSFIKLHLPVELLPNDRFWRRLN